LAVASLHGEPLHATATGYQECPAFAGFARQKQLFRRFNGAPGAFGICRPEQWPVI